MKTIEQIVGFHALLHEEKRYIAMCQEAQREAFKRAAEVARQAIPLPGSRVDWHGAREQIAAAIETLKPE